VPVPVDNYFHAVHDDKVGQAEAHDTQAPSRAETCHQTGDTENDDQHGKELGAENSTEKNERWEIGPKEAFHTSAENHEMRAAGHLQIDDRL